MSSTSRTRRPQETGAYLEDIYRRYNRRELVHPDPLEFVYRYPSALDREVVGLIASALAYGRIGQILRSVELVLGRLGDSPAATLREAGPRRARALTAGFRHRWTDEGDLAGLLLAAGRLQAERGSLEAAFAATGGAVEDRLCAFVDELARAAGSRPESLLPLPALGSACKRLHLYLRWMVRDDDVDPGVWSCVSPAELLVPLDTHMLREARRLGFTERRQADLRTAREVTEAFRRYAPDDPVKYDFSLTRLGILGIRNARSD